MKTIQSNIQRLRELVTALAAVLCLGSCSDYLDKEPLSDYLSSNFYNNEGAIRQGAMGCYLAAYISAGNTVHVGYKVDIPNIGEVEILANSDLVAGQETAEENNGVVLLPERVVFTAENVANYPF